PSEKWIEHKILLLAERRPLNQYQLPAILRINYAKTARFTRASETAPHQDGKFDGRGCRVFRHNDDHGISRGGKDGQLAEVN
ncbi:MAG TPA: hypothetical protein VMV69_06640, partial [Pirellulales bacterium]|nr:hypothetical protein [Pirellulales bacterium]